MKRGDLVMICIGAPIFHDEWVKGDRPNLTEERTPGIFLEAQPEVGDAPRIFWRVITHMGVGTVNSKFCEAVNLENKSEAVYNESHE